MNHAYGNYIIQRLFEFADENLRNRLCEKIFSESIDDLKKNNYGKIC
jgi:hypothetical protein